MESNPIKILESILPTILSILSLLISSGFIVALFSIRSQNRKIQAEAIKAIEEAKKISAEAKKIGKDSDLESFKEQVDGIKQLSGVFENRLDIMNTALADCNKREVELSNQLTACNKREIEFEKIIKELREALELKDKVNQKLKDKTDSLYSLISRMIDIISDMISNNIDDIRKRQIKTEIETIKVEFAILQSEEI